MFAYNPTVNDMSGQILGQGVVNSANTKANAQVKMVEDIGGSLAGLAGSLAGGYMKKKEMESAVKAGDQMINMFGDQLGITTDKLKGFGYDEMGLDDKYAMHQNLWGNLGALSNMRMANRGADIREQGQQIQQMMPAYRAQLNAASQVAGGQGRMTSLPPNINPNAIP